MAITPLRIYRLVFGGLFTALGVWAAACIVLGLEAIRAAWPDWLILMFPALIVAMGLFALLAVFRNSCREQLPFFRYRSGAARMFGSVTVGLYVVFLTLHRVAQQKTLHGVVLELIAAAILIGLLALVFGAINGDIRDQEKSGPE
jgi:hypothetical protein